VTRAIKAAVRTLPGRELPSGKGEAHDPDRDHREILIKVETRS